MLLAPDRVDVLGYLERGFLNTDAVRVARMSGTDLEGVVVRDSGQIAEL